MVKNTLFLQKAWVQFPAPTWWSITSHRYAFLGSARDFETSYGGSTYILHVFDYLPTGSVMPYEYASRRIADMMEREKKADYRIRLLTSLYSKSIEEGRLKPGLYDPIKRKMRQEVASDNENKNKKRT